MIGPRLYLSKGKKDRWEKPSGLTIKDVSWSYQMRRLRERFYDSYMTIGGQDIWGGMKQHDGFSETISGPQEESGSLDTSRGVQPANKTRISYI